MHIAKAVHTASEVVASTYKILVTLILSYYLIKSTRDARKREKLEVHP